MILAPNNYRWFVLVLILLATAIGIMIFAAPFPLLNLWVKGLGISRAQAGSLTGIWYLMFVLLALPAGWLTDHVVRIRPMFLSFWTLIVVGTSLMAKAPDFWTLCLGRMVFSAGMVGHSIAAPKLLTTWFERRKEFGLVMGLYSMSMTAGVSVSLFVLGRIGEYSGWRPAMSLLVVLASVALLMMFFVRRQLPESHQKSPIAHSLPRQLGMAACVFAITFGGYNIATEAYLTFTPDYLVHYGYGLASASTVVAIYAWIALGLKPFLSFFLRRSNATLYVVVASLFLLFSIALLIFYSGSAAVSASFFGISMALAMPALYALPPLMFGNKTSGRVYGLCQFFYGLGFIVQPLIGLTVDKTGHYATGYAIICGTAGLTFLGALWLSRSRLKCPKPATPGM